MLLGPLHVLPTISYRSSGVRGPWASPSGNSVSQGVGSGGLGWVRHVVGYSGQTVHRYPSPQIPYSSSSPGSYTVSGAETGRPDLGGRGCWVADRGPFSHSHSMCRDPQEEVGPLEHPSCPALEVLGPVQCLGKGVLAGRPPHFLALMHPVP